MSFSNTSAFHNSPLTRILPFGLRDFFTIPFLPTIEKLGTVVKKIDSQIKREFINEEEFIAIELDNKIVEISHTLKALYQSYIVTD